MHLCIRIRYILLIATLFSLFVYYLTNLNLGASNNEDNVGENLKYEDVISEKLDIGIYDIEWLDNLPLPFNISRQVSCLAEAIYFEARGEIVLGQLSVGQVILNRVKNDGFPDNACDVIYQGQHLLNKCQFSYICDGKPENIEEPIAYENAIKLAKYLFDERDFDIIGNSLFYHSNSVHPYWADIFVLRENIGNHLFYEEPS